MFNKTSKADEAVTSDAPARTAAPPARSNAVPSIISADLVIEGNMRSSGEIQIDGRVVGDIESRSLTIGQTAEVQGLVSCETVRVNGSMSGEIRAKSVIIAKTAQVNGDIVHESVAIETGAHIEGHLRRADRQPAERLPPPNAWSDEAGDEPPLPATAKDGARKG